MKPPRSGGRSISVVVGTAAVAGKDVAYAKLALVVIDEEQRFGAADKEVLRKLADEGHVLSLTATPIPRTLLWQIRCSA